MAEESEGTAAAIVAGTDGSVRAEQAVTRAAELAGVLGATLHLVCAYRRVSDSAWVAASAGTGLAGLPSDDELVRGEAEEVVARASQRLEGRGLDVHGHVYAGDAAQALITIAENESAGMIVVGNRGMHGARRLIGSVPDRVAHRTSCEVLIVPTD